MQHIQAPVHRVGFSHTTEFKISGLLHCYSNIQLNQNQVATTMTVQEGVKKLVADTDTK